MTVSILTESAYLQGRRLNLTDAQCTYDDFSGMVFDGGFLPHDTMVCYRDKESERNGAFAFAHIYWCGEKGYYVTIESFLESCDGCYKCTYDELMRDAVSKAYVTETLQEAHQYLDSRGYLPAED